MELFPKPNSQTSLKQAYRSAFPEDAGDREETHRFPFALTFPPQYNYSWIFIHKVPLGAFPPSSPLLEMPVFTELSRSPFCPDGGEKSQLMSILVFN